jgi:hypothetical protein
VLGSQHEPTPVHAVAVLVQMPVVVLHVPPPVHPVHTTPAAPHKVFNWSA